jgi:hypothetical protein
MRRRCRRVDYMAMSTPTLTSRVAALERWRDRLEGADDARRRTTDAGYRLAPIALATASIVVTLWKAG